MRIKKLFLEMAIMLTAVSFVVVAINSFQAHRNASHELEYLQKQYLNATYEIYKNEIIGDILIGNKKIILALLSEITQARGVGAILTYGKLIISTGHYVAQTPVISYSLNLGNEKFAQLKLYHLKNLKVFNFIDELVIPLLLQVLILGIGFLWLLQRIKRRLIDPLNALLFNLDTGNIDSFSLNNKAVDELNQLGDTLKKMNTEIRKKAQYEAESITAKQVAHDIRSPLACLNLLLSYVTALPEKQRILMRSSVQRITDIANLLQSKAEKNNDPKLILSEDQSTVVMISSLVEMLVTEKRMQLGLTTNVRIDLNLDNAYGLFSKIDSNEFKRVLSNLINNSLEAFDEFPHNIFIAVTHENEKILVTIKDDGRGIPEDILDKIGTHGFSYGKENLKLSGSGLGVNHALKTIASFDGELFINSTPNVGTQVTICLPKLEPLVWFVREINLDLVKRVVILDDDQSIHDLWQDRFSRYNDHNNFIMHFSSAQEFQNFVQDKLNSFEQLLFLVDYELVRQGVTGLTIIEQCKINARAFLVTSHHDEVHIQTKAVSLGVGIIPKGVVPFIPVFRTLDLLHNLD